MLWVSIIQVIVSALTLRVAVVALSNWRRQLRNQNTDKCLSDAKLYEGAFNRYVDLRCNDAVPHEDKVKAYDEVWLSLRNLMASYEVVKRYDETLIDDIGAQCRESGIVKIPLLKEGQAPGAKDGADGQSAKTATEQIIADLGIKLGEPKRFLGLGL